MKIQARRTILVTVMVALSGAIGFPASAGDSRGPACNDFISGAHVYATDQSPGSPTFGQGVVSATSDFAAPTCASWDYAIYVLNGDGTRLLGSQTKPGDGTPTLGHRIAVANDPVLPPSSVCIYGESTRNGRLGDRAPDSGCLVLNLDKDPGGQAWN